MVNYGLGAYFAHPLMLSSPQEPSLRFLFTSAVTRHYLDLYPLWPQFGPPVRHPTQAFAWVKGDFSCIACMCLSQ